MKLKFFSLLLLISLLFVGCNPDSDIVPKTGELQVQLTDAPFQYDLVSEANVTVFKVEIGGEVGFTEIPLQAEFQVNLLELTNGVTETLFNGDIPVGIYSQVRVYVKDASVVLTDGTVYDLKVPSGGQTGIKVNISPALEVAGGLSSDLLLDFDVSKSFVARGNIDSPNFNGFIFKPTIKAANLSETGTLSGTVTTLVTTEASTEVAPIEGVQVSVIVADTVNTTSFTDVSGQYTVLGLEGGTYSLDFEVEGYEFISVDGVVITPANLTTVDVELEEVKSVE